MIHLLILNYNKTSMKVHMTFPLIAIEFVIITVVIMNSNSNY